MHQSDCRAMGPASRVGYQRDDSQNVYTNDKIDVNRWMSARWHPLLSPIQSEIISASIGPTSISRIYAGTSIRMSGA